MTQQLSSSGCSPRKTLNFRSSEVDTDYQIRGEVEESKDIPPPPLSPNMKPWQMSVLDLFHPYALFFLQMVLVTGLVKVVLLVIITKQRELSLVTAII